jgi:hypothetical protein
MSELHRTLRDEVQRVRSVSDMLCTAHAALRDKFFRLALLLDISLLVLSTWIAALAFVTSPLSEKLTPFRIDPQLWIGFLSLGAFALTLIGMKTDWRGRSDAHKRSFSGYAEVKKDSSLLLAVGRELHQGECEQLMNKYRMASELGVEIPENEFLCQKRRHKLKIAISKHLDTHPAASIWLLRIKLWCRDNVKGHKNK